MTTARSLAGTTGARCGRAGPGTGFMACIGLMLALGPEPVWAAALGSLTTSVGLFTTLVAVLVVNGWPAQAPASALSAGSVLMVACGGFWLWRVHHGERRDGLMEAGARGRASTAVGRRANLALVSLPEGFDSDALLVDFRNHFLRLQDAWDKAAMAELRELTTPEMLDELHLGLPASTAQASATGRTEVVTLDAHLFAFETLGGAFLASVEFSGLMRESSGEGAHPFRELWMLTRSKDDLASWKLARHQALL